MITLETIQIKNLQNIFVYSLKNRDPAVSGIFIWQRLKLTGVYSEIDIQ